MANETDLLKFLDSHLMAYQRVEHVPLFSTKQAEEVMKDVPGIPSKNLFLEGASGKLFLLATTDKKRVDLKALKSVLCEKNISFGSAEKLKSALGVEPGSVTLFCAMNDPAHAVRILIDREIVNGDLVQCHPLINTATLLIKVSELLKFFEVIGHPFEAFDVPEKA